MNIFNMSDKEFENYLKNNIDNKNPQILLKQLIECGLLFEEFDNIAGDDKN